MFLREIAKRLIEWLDGSPTGAGIRNNLDAYYADKSRKPYIVCESKDIELNIKAAMMGLGISLLPHYFVITKK